MEKGFATGEITDANTLMLNEMWKIGGVRGNIYLQIYVHKRLMMGKGVHTWKYRGYMWKHTYR